MGMFDYVIEMPKAAENCQGCGAELDGWQTKDGERLLSSIPFKSPDLNKAYTICDNCNDWIEVEKGIFDKKAFSIRNTKTVTGRLE